MATEVYFSIICLILINFDSSLLLFNTQPRPQCLLRFQWQSEQKQNLDKAAKILKKNREYFVT